MSTMSPSMHDDDVLIPTWPGNLASRCELGSGQELDAMFRDLFAKLFPTWSSPSVAARAEAATKARDAAFYSFQRLLKDGGYSDVLTVATATLKTVQAPSIDATEGSASDEPTRDTQDGPSSNPTGVGPSREGPALRRTN